MASSPKKNPRTVADYEKIIDALLLWEAQKPHDQKLLKMFWGRFPNANAIDADRRFWLAELLADLQQRIAADQSLSNGESDALTDRIQYELNEAPLDRQNYRKGDPRAQELADDVRRRSAFEDARPHEIVRHRQRLKLGELEENPPWVTKMLADSLVTLQEQVPPKWLPKLEGTSSRGNQIKAELVEYGCGAYGCVMQTLDDGVVLKLTSDPSEAKFAAEIADTLPTDICVHYHTIVKMTGQERKGREVFLLWREAAQDVGKIDKLVDMTAERAIRKQHKAALAAYLALAGGDTETFMELIETWRKTCHAMAKIPELTFVADGLLRAWDEKGVFISDIHGGNLGRCVRNGELAWVITDPGNVVLSTQHADEHSRFDSGPTTVVQKNPGKRPRCPRDHDALKLDDAAWEKLDYVGRTEGYDEDENECWLELRNCTCKSTLARPEKSAPAPTENPTIPKKGAMAFFEEWAGYSRRPDEKPRNAQRRNARELAVAEYVLEEEHPETEVIWEVDDDGAFFWREEGEVFDGCFGARIPDPERKQFSLAAIGGITDPDANYRRLIEAELALEAFEPRVNELAAQLHARRGRPLKTNPHPNVEPYTTGRYMRLLIARGGRHGKSANPVSVYELARLRAEDMATNVSESLVAEFVIETRRYLNYLVDHDLVAKMTSPPFLDPRAEHYALSNKALSYDDVAVAKWPTMRDVGAGVLALQSLASAEFARYLKSFLSDAWDVAVTGNWHDGGSTHRMEVRSDAGDHAIVIVVSTRRDASWPTLDMFVVANRYPGVTPAPTDWDIHDRNWPHSPQELVAMILPFTDVYHP